MNLPSNIALSRLIAAQRAMDVTAQNIANASTSGYKSEHVLFTDWLSRGGSSPDSSTGGAAEATVAYTQDRATWHDQAEGTLTHTGNTFDLALAGNGYFTVATPNGTRLTRDGQFGLMPDGTVSSQNGQLGQIGVVVPSDPMRVTAEGGSLYRADVPTTQAASPGVVQGAVEGSNVEPVMEITRMMDGLRQFQFVSEMIQAESDRQQSAIDKLLPQGT